MRTAVALPSRNDCSQVPVWELARVLKPFVDRMEAMAEDDPENGWSVNAWVASVKGLDPAHISRVIEHKVPTIGLRVVDLICHAMGQPELIHTFTFIPGTYTKKFAREMATEEYRALHGDDVDLCEDFISRRSAELIELRERVLSEGSSAA